MWEHKFRQVQVCKIGWEYKQSLVKETCGWEANRRLWNSGTNYNGERLTFEVEVLLLAVYTIGIYSHEHNFENV